MRAGTGARGTLWSNWSPQKEKSKLVNRKIEITKKMRRKKLTPRQQASASSGEARQSFASSLSELVQARA
jgi:hypothetical protein